MSKKRARSQLAEELHVNIPAVSHVNQDRNIENVEIKDEPIDDGYYEPIANILPTQICRGTDENWTNAEAETGLVSQLDIIKMELNIADDATVKAFRDEVMQCCSHQNNEKIVDEPPPSKKPKTVSKEKKKEKTKTKKKPETNIQKRRNVDLINPSIKTEPQPIEFTVNGKHLVKCCFCDYQRKRRDRSIVKEHIRIHTGRKPFACTHCPKKFHKRSLLIDHIQQMHPTKPIYKCPLCHIYSLTKTDFQAHEFKCVKRSTFECHLCKSQEKRFRLNDAQEHMRRFHTAEKIYRCEYCEEDAFITRSRLTCHIRQNHPEAVPFKCSTCQLRFFSEETHKKHVDYCMKRKRYECHLCRYTVPLSSAFSTLTMHMQMHTGAKPYQCQYCHKFYPRAEALWHHQQRHSELFKFKCKRCHRRCMDQKELTEHEEICRRRRYECHLCGFTKFGISYNKFRRHVASNHIGEKSVKCIGCPGTFSTIALLVHHISIKHSQLLALVCPNCNGRFATRAARNNHFAQCFKRRIECYICIKTMRTMEQLRTHMVNTHIGRSKFKCHLCPRQYFMERNLKMHIQSHTKVGWVHCDYCKKKFADIKFKRKHEFQCKKVYECYLCKKKLPSFVNLHGVHMRTHLGQRPYSCAHCTKTFVSIRTYDLHVMDAHLKEYRFQCNTCKEFINVKQDVKKHQKSCMKPIRKSKGIIYFKCSLCAVGLARIPELRQHILQKQCKNIAKGKKIKTEKL